MNTRHKLGFLHIRIPTAFTRCQRGAAAVEFALVGLALFLFIYAIVNLGMLGFSVAAQARALQAAARQAAMDASNNFATTNSACEDSAAVIRGYFNQYASPPLPPATGSTTDGSPQVTATWVTPATAPANAPPGLYLQLAVTNKWVPLGLPMFGNGLSVTLGTAATVMGTSTYTKTTTVKAC